MLASLRRAALVTLVVCCCGPALAQGSPPGDPFLLSPQAFTFPALSGAGLSATFGVAVADVGAVNPAALGAFDRAELGLAYKAETSVDGGYLSEFFDYEAEHGARPQSAAVVVPVGALRLGAGYAQRYAGGLGFDTIITETDTAASSFTSRVETFSPQAAYRLEHALAEGDAFTLGLRVGLGRAEHEERLDTLVTRFSEWSTHVAVGASYRTGAARPLGLGLYYESPLRFETTTTLRFPDVEFPSGEVVGVISVPVRYRDALPGRLGLSLHYEPTPTLRLGADAARVFWEDAGRERAQLDASAHARLDVSRDALVSFGVFSQGRGLFDEDVADAFGYGGRAVYLTAGGAVTFGRLRLDAVIADGRLLSAEEHRQTLVKLGASVWL
jgi:hypothetical protein